MGGGICIQNRGDAKGLCRLKQDNSTINPPHVGQHRILHVGIVEVEVWLRGEEVVQEVLHAPAVPGPGQAARRWL